MKGALDLGRVQHGEGQRVPHDEDAAPHHDLLREQVRVGRCGADQDDARAGLLLRWFWGLLVIVCVRYGARIG